METDDLPPSARRVLDAARAADDPTDADRARVDAAFAKRLQALGIAPALNSNPPPSPAPAATGSTGLASKAALALIGVGIATVAFVQLRHAGDPKPPQRIPVATAPAARAIEPHAPAAPNAAPQPSSIDAASRAIATPSAARASDARPRRSTPARRTVVAVTRRPVPQNAPADSLRDEVVLLETADRALRDGRFAAALRALDAHERRFANGALREERMGLRVLALCAAGDSRAGNAARRDFLREAPHSVLARKVMHACVETPSSAPEGRDGPGE